MLQSSVGVKSGVGRNFGILKASIQGGGRYQRCNRRRTLLTLAGKDYYNVLGVSKSADKKDIKSAYRQKARKYHPDVNKSSNAVEQFKEISEAYEVLNDEQKRQIYDAYGEEGLKGGLGGMGGMGDFTDPFDIFEQFFGGFGGFGGFDATVSEDVPSQGENEEYELVISFMEAAFGCTKNVKTSRLVQCPKCDGRGTKSGTEQTCFSCGGQGRVSQRLSTPLGEMQQVVNCPACNGSGRTSQDCGKCVGDGRIRENKKVDIQIPAGIDDGQRLRLAGEGSAGRRGGPVGDMFVKIHVTKHPKLERKGINIQTEVELNYTEAILGGAVIVDTIDGEVELRIPAGTQPGSTLKLAGKGVPKIGARDKRGDQMVRIRVKIPTQLSSEEKNLVQQLDDLKKVVAPRVKVGAKARRR